MDNSLCEVSPRPVTRLSEHENASAANRRQHDRTNVKWRARLLKKGTGIGAAVVTNASLGGVFLETSMHIDVTDELLLELYVGDGPDSHRLRCAAKVMRKVPCDTSSWCGFGLRFTRIEDDDLTYLLSAIASAWSTSLRPPFSSGA